MVEIDGGPYRREAVRGVAFKNFCMAFGRQVRAIRKRRGLSQEAAAERADVTVRHFQKIEAGEAVTMYTVWRLARALGVPPGKLLP